MRNLARPASIRFKRIRTKKQPATAPAPLARRDNCVDPGEGGLDPRAKAIEQVLGIILDYLDDRQSGRREPAVAEQSSHGKVNRSAGKVSKQVDTVALFLEECCNCEDPKGRAYSHDLFDLFTGWARSGGRPLLSQNALSRRLKGLGFSTKKSGKMLFMGITLTCSPDDLRRAA